MHVKSNDRVQLLAGKDRGKIGKIQRVILKKNRVVVEKLNMVKRHQKPTEKNRTGGIVDKEAPIHVSNVALYCEKCGKGVRTRVRFVGDGAQLFLMKEEARASFPEGSTQRVRRIRICVHCETSFD